MTQTGRKKAANSEYLTTQEVADRLRVTQRTVYNWISNQLLEADKAGPKIWVISEAQLQVFLTRSRPKPRRMFEMQGADPSKWGRAGQRVGQRTQASAVQPVPPQKSPDRPAPVRLGDLVQVLEARFGPGEHEFEHESDERGAYGSGPSSPLRPSIPPAKISSKKKAGGRRR
jgi:excisionase family DNA binding protein